ncbi:conserved hypothetical protein [Desulfosarcina cetonica]|uniref:hypothetical protein n=1 Tax=Desulfosarcina cetonica TaxID=90730 RepID=UPI0006CF8F52|nr:hypothetical protein [Desulfosarcina cetonica]VTR68673.1 conserved hypothetical protein [Desulfosarcina cetonica]
MDKKEYISLFSAADDAFNNAILNRFSDQIEAYTMGYKEAADILAKYVLQSQCFQDILIYPIIFLYRQYIELRLKEIIQEGRNFLGDEGSYPKHHRLHHLWDTVKSIIMRIYNLSDEPNEFDLIGKLVSDFKKFDPDSSSFRYPAGRRGNKPLKEISYINIRQFVDVINEISIFLEGVSSEISVFIDHNHER